jgi:hypothetical protein
MRQREIPDIFASDRMDQSLDLLLGDSDPRLRLYVYRIRDGRKVTPALVSGYPFEGLFDYLRDRFGSGRYWIMIRRGREMELSGAICIEAPLNWRPRPTAT